MTTECHAGFLWCQDGEDFPPPCSSPFALNSNLAGGGNCGLSVLGGGGGVEEGGGEKENKGEGGGGGKGEGGGGGGGTSQEGREAASHMFLLQGQQAEAGREKMP